ncbi:excinuclease ABC subunit UvrB [Mycoplasma crocodyli]|uniref:UvrABC system protein B n=1 Tax=Mycoplasma crocodyli (strain ATCC 51981 / MP145) TaxID=512564 RepID=D5E658_MYCCM|nr:excinuclease ABC subunit UvrB [Mycoplasma crocodyli]ADE19696.1 excinuclease UvrABC system, helicase subunit (UvrB) [Mycoplasma crocodyli MP145]
MSIYQLRANYKPSGDQPRAIQELSEGVAEGLKHQVLEGVTGSGKTFTIANVIQNFDRPVLVLSHNKTLASQLYSELKSFFPHNAVEYFVSYFDYYRPEAYIPTSDTYIEKTSKTNQDIELLRMSTINSLLRRRDTIVVASVSSIYGALNPQEYQKGIFEIFKGMDFNFKEFLRTLIKIKYDRNDIDNPPATFAVRGDTVFISPADSDEFLLRIDFFGDTIEAIYKVDKVTKNIIKEFKVYAIYPGEAYTVENSIFDKILPMIQEELNQRIKYFNENNKLLEAQRISERVKNDMDEMAEYGFCGGIENYTMYLDGRDFNQRPFTLFDYLPNDTIIFLDESHMMIPQLHGMYKGDRARKETLVNYGFRLPSALENRPLKFHEFEQAFDFQKIYISATPNEYEIDQSQGLVTKLYVRPTGLLDPILEMRPTKNQIEDIFDEIKIQNDKNQRTIVLTTTKRSAEELSSYMQKRNIKSAYIHSEYDTFKRNEILRKLRKGIYDVVIGINLLREGIDLPEVSLVVVLDADKEGFMRNRSSLIQIAGRAARNKDGRVIFYADVETKSLKATFEDNKEKRELQIAYNKKHNITPQTIYKEIAEPIQGHDIDNALEAVLAKDKKITKQDKEELIKKIKVQMKQAAKDLDYERAIELRDLIIEIEKS